MDTINTQRNGQYWNLRAQTKPASAIYQNAEEGIRREWERVFDLPLSFYQQKYRAAGLTPDEVPHLNDVPLTTKAELRANEKSQPPFGTHRSVSMREAIRIGGSTGTSGDPVILMFGPKDLELAIEHQCRVLWRYGLRPGDSFTHSFPQGFYISSTTTALWYTRIPILEVPVGPPISVSVAAEHLSLWRSLRPDGFQMTSAQLATYEDAARTIRMDLREIFNNKPIGLLDAIYQFEEPRRRLEEMYGFRITNMGGAGEIPGFGVTDCQYHTGLHVPSDQVIIQVVDPATGKPVPEGERGHLVLTALGFDTFLLRYDLEDICTMSTGPCPCGETGARFTLLGRDSDMVEVGARKLLPIDVQAVLDARGAPEFAFEPQSRQNGNNLCLKIEGDGQATDHALAIEAALKVPVRVEEAPVNSLPRSSFKPRRVAQ